MINLYFSTEVGEVKGLSPDELRQLRRNAADGVLEHTRNHLLALPGKRDKGVKPVTLTHKSALTDLIERIEPMNEQEGGTIYRGLSVDPRDIIKDIKNTGYGVRPNFVTESWAAGEGTAKNFAGKGGVVLVCKKYQNRKRVDGIYKKLDMKNKNPQHPESTEGESFFPSSSSFDYVNHYQKNGITYIEVLEHVALAPS
ncbi:MAG: hypothetical protein R3Y56_07700 [Akkermansia sp.]